MSDVNNHVTTNTCDSTETLRVFKTNEAHSVVSRRKITRTLPRDGPQPLRRPLEATARSSNEKMTNVYFEKNERSYRSTVQGRFYTVRTEISPFSRVTFSLHIRNIRIHIFTKLAQKSRLVFNTTIRTNES